MKVPLRWLEEFIELPTTDPVELSDVLTMLGHEVESFEVLEPGWTGVFVGRDGTVLVGAGVSVGITTCVAVGAFFVISTTKVCTA
jgi:hypothetical protein